MGVRSSPGKRRPPRESRIRHMPAGPSTSAKRAGSDTQTGRPQVDPGYPAAHTRVAEPLLPSGPGGVGRLVLRRTGTHRRPARDFRSGYFKSDGRGMAEREGFEPSVELPPHMISSHADSAWLSHLSA